MDCQIIHISLRDVHFVLSGSNQGYAYLPDQRRLFLLNI
jgi:hypothetical protein